MLEDLGGAYDTSVAAAEARISDDPGFVSKDWRAWCLEPESVEFWQADSGRRHQRWVVPARLGPSMDTSSAVALRGSWAQISSR